MRQDCYLSCLLGNLAGKESMRVQKQNSFSHGGDCQHQIRRRTMAYGWREMPQNPVGGRCREIKLLFQCRPNLYVPCSNSLNPLITSSGIFCTSLPLNQ